MIGPTQPNKTKQNYWSNPNPILLYIIGCIGFPKSFFYFYLKTNVIASTIQLSIHLSSALGDKHGTMDASKAWFYQLAEVSLCSFFYFCL